MPILAHDLNEVELVEPIRPASPPIHERPGCWRLSGAGAVSAGLHFLLLALAAGVTVQALERKPFAAIDTRAEPLLWSEPVEVRLAGQRDADAFSASGNQDGQALVIRPKASVEGDALEPLEDSASQSKGESPSATAGAELPRSRQEGRMISKNGILRRARLHYYDGRECFVLETRAGYLGQYLISGPDVELDNGVNREVTILARAVHLAMGQDVLVVDSFLLMHEPVGVKPKTVASGMLSVRGLLKQEREGKFHLEGDLGTLPLSAGAGVDLAPLVDKEVLLTGKLLYDLTGFVVTEAKVCPQ